MSKVTISFKGSPIQTVKLLGNETSIGRDPSNTIHIDSLAIADFHARIIATPKGYVIKASQAEYPIYFDSQVITEKLLNDGDNILIGKHTIQYIHEPYSAGPVGREEPPSRPAAYRSFEGSFQIMNGKRIGMVIPLKAAVTQIGKEASGMVKVSRTDHGYTISPGSAEVLLTINGKPVTGGEEPLSDGDVIRINSSLLQFFHK